MADWDDDIAKIRKSGPIRADIIVAWEEVKPLLISAWQYGYTTGMADAAKLEQMAADQAREEGKIWNPMSQRYEDGP